MPLCIGPRIYGQVYVIIMYNQYKLQDSVLDLECGTIFDMNSSLFMAAGKSITVAY